jgi:hypothetical protein
LVAGELPREAHNAPLHLFSASPDLLAFGRGAYLRRSERTSRILLQLFERYQGEGFSMSFTLEDFDRWFFDEHFAKLPPEQQQAVLRSLPPEQQQAVLQALPPEQRLAGLSVEQIRRYLDQLTASRPAQPRKPRRKR